MHWGMQLILLILIPNQSNHTIQHLQFEGLNTPLSISRTQYFGSPTVSSTAGSRLPTLWFQAWSKQMCQTSRCPENLGCKLQLFPIPRPNEVAYVPHRWGKSSEVQMKPAPDHVWMSIAQHTHPKTAELLIFNSWGFFLVGFINLVALPNPSSPELQAVLRTESAISEKDFKSLRAKCTYSTWRQCLHNSFTFLAENLSRFCVCWVA